MTTVMTRSVAGVAASHPVRLRRAQATPEDRALALRLLVTCDPAGVRARFAGAARPEANAPWLLPRAPGDLALVALSGDDPVGWVNLARVGAGVYEVGIIVAEAWRGRRLGSWLVRSAVEHAGDAVEVVGGIQPGNRPALALLRSLAGGRHRMRPDDGWLRFAVGTAGLRSVP